MLLAGVGDDGLVTDRPGHQKGVAAATTGSGAQLVEAGVAGDGQQPGPGGRVASKPRQRPKGSQEGLLGEVVAALLIDEGGAESPDRFVAGVDERFQGGPVTGPSESPAG